MADKRRNQNGLHMEAHGQGPALLLTHGFGATCRMWDEQIEEFTDRHRLITWDLPGHGQSTPASARKITPGRLMTGMLSVLDHAEAPRAVLVGLGLGGALSLRFWRAHRARVRAMVLIGVTPGLRGAATRMLWNAQVAAQAGWLERDGLEALEGGAEVDPRLHTDSAALAEAARGLLTQPDAGALDWLAEIDVPVLILTGGDDQPNLTAARHMARVIPGARAVVIPRANHAVTMHKPDAANAAIREFLGRLPP